MIPRSRARAGAGLIAILLLGLGAATPAHAAPDRDGASSVVARAVLAYKAKHYQEAAELFLEAYQRSGVPNQIRNAAKAYQDGELYDEAEHSWRRFREHHGVSPAEIAEADAQIGLIAERRRAAEATRQAEAAKKEAEAARAAQEQAEVARAKEAEDARQANARADEAERAKADEPPPAVVPPAPPPPAAIVAPAPPPEAGPPIAAWVTAGVGAAAVITGGVLLLHASGRLSTLDEQLAMKDGGGRIVGTSPAEAQGEVDGINTERWIGGTSLGVGAGAVLVGLAWWMLSD